VRGRARSTGRTVATGGEISWPPVGSFVAAYGEFLVAAVRKHDHAERATARQGAPSMRPRPFGRGNTPSVEVTVEEMT